MNPTMIIELAAHAADVAATDGDPVTRIQMGEMADGSRRHFALVETDSHGLEQEYRIASPAPADAPPWARQFDRWTYEVRNGETWILLNDDDDEPEQSPAAAPVELTADERAVLEEFASEYSRELDPSDPVERVLRSALAKLAAAPALTA